MSKRKRPPASWAAAKTGSQDGGRDGKPLCPPGSLLEGGSKLFALGKPSIHGAELDPGWERARLPQPGIGFMGSLVSGLSRCVTCSRDKGLLPCPSVCFHLLVLNQGKLQVENQSPAGEVERWLLRTRCPPLAGAFLVLGEALTAGNHRERGARRTCWHVGDCLHTGMSHKD